MNVHVRYYKKQPINNRKQSYTMTHCVIIMEQFTSKELPECVVQRLPVIADNLVTGVSFYAEFDANCL